MLHHPFPSIDIFEAVIDQASDDVASLRQVSLTCTALQPRARYHLFSRICIRSVEQARAAPVFLDTHPWLPPLIKKVSLSPGPLYGDHWQGVKNAPLLDIHPVHILSRLPNLRAWKLELVGSPLTLRGPWLSLHRSTLSCYRRYGGRIWNLELSHVPFDDVSDFTGLVSAFTGINSISCSYVRFRVDSKERPFFYRSGPSRLARSLDLRTLNLGDFVDIRATCYLLASSGSALSHLVLTMSHDAIPSLIGYSSEQNAVNMIWLRQLSSLRLIIPCYDDFNRNRDPDADFSRFVRNTTNFLEHVERTRLADVQVEFKMHSSGIALLGACLARQSTTFQSCIALDASLAGFPLGHISCVSSVQRCRVGRVAFWSPAFEHAFPKLSADRRVALVTPKGKDIPPRLGHEGPVSVIVASPDSKWIATASEDGTIILWDAAGGTIVHEWLVHSGYAVLALAFSPNSARLVSAGGTEGLALWELGLRDIPRRAAALEGHTHPVNACAWSPDGTWIASASGDGTVRVLNALTFEEQYRVHEADASPQGLGPAHLRFSPDSRYLAWGALSRRGDTYGYMVWSPAQAREQPKWLPTSQHAYEAFSFPVGALSFDPESARIVTAYGSASSQDAHVARVWDPATGAMLAVLGARDSVTVTDISFSPDGSSIVSASLDGSVKIWDAGSGVEKASLESSTTRTPGVTKACFSPDGKFVATITQWSSTVKLWRTSDASCTAEFIGHEGTEVSQVTFSPNGEFLVSGDSDGIVVIDHLPDSLRYS